MGRCRFRQTTSERDKNNPHEYVVKYLAVGAAATIPRDGSCHQKAKGYSKRYGGWLYWYYHLNGFEVLDL